MLRILRIIVNFQAAKLKRSMTPLTCAVVGTALGGPVGGLFGLKAALGGAMASAILGYCGVKLVQKKNEVEYDGNKES